MHVKPPLKICLSSDMKFQVIQVSPIEKIHLFNLSDNSLHCSVKINKIKINFQDNARISCCCNRWGLILLYQFYGSFNKVLSIL